MENTPYLYETLLGVLGQHSQWLDLRHRKTLAWMMVGLICAKTVGLGAWASFAVSRAQYAQSVVRRFRRWLDNNRIKSEPLYGPLIEKALVSWMGKRVYVALDTSMLWNTYCLIRLSVIYRGRAVPLAWRVIEHGSAMVAFETYQEVLDEAQRRLPLACQVVFLADRGFADTQLMSQLRQRGWHFRIRIKANFWIHPSHLASFQVGEIELQPGHMSFWHDVLLTDKRFGPVHFAVARPLGSDEYWYVISDEAADLKTLQEYGLRFDIEENFLDDIEWISVGSVADPVGGGAGAAVFCTRHHDAVLGLGGDLGREARQAASGRPALVSGGELLEDWLELGDLCTHQRLRAAHDGVLE